MTYSLAVYIFTYLTADFCPEVQMEVVHIFQNFWLCFNS